MNTSKKSKNTTSTESSTTKKTSKNTATSTDFSRSSVERKPVHKPKNK